MKKALVILFCFLAFTPFSIVKAQAESILDNDYYEVDSVSFSTTDSTEVVLSTRDYFNLLSTPDSVTGAVMNIYQDSLIFLAINKKFSGEAEEVKGFRIQIFSSNRGALARERAFEIKDILLSKHPSLEDEIYITYTSPFWKVRIGNCQTNAKAQELRRWIIAEFPEFAVETYIVPSMIFVY